MKKLFAAFLALMMLGSLAACGEGGFSLKPNNNGDDKNSGKEDDSDFHDGYIGDKMSTYWFDFTVDEAYSCKEFEGYTADAGKKLVVATISLRNTCGNSVDMWGDDFMIVWDDPDEDSGIDIPLLAGISDEQFPDEYTLGINGRRTNIAIYEVPEEFRDFAIYFQEIMEDENDPEGVMGEAFFVSFTPEEK